ncbi:bifunctional transcriptional activator/DNA repair enzyme AdaA [Ohtaekwangia koreensis]|uniref:Methylated-DNA--protein-cysteine methyltransferase n=1 Tax=Ohtaekwangia koreensis TaxID=688867 RepID=A0A1T5MCZ8_9BACT|nr:methylated-DNA--[protein]-cysteine S-methyltransferase [Ohtaekwangia koreensis]SKC86035.1 AraC family transcriptional regulator, regulatory protein of adaptative response / methylated-DNA-[protein]-cysteine methyltransferase [Ohtaekwangia koreensis]
MMPRIVNKVHTRKALSFQDKYNAMLREDPSFEGVFITAVKTTGIFCRPACRARKPKAENVVFYESPQEAIEHGFRPCKICKPMEQASTAPKPIHDLIEELNSNPYIRIKDYDLRQRGIEPSQVRRWFKKHHNLSFHAYQRMLRINSAFNKITVGESVTNTAFDSGYNSLSGFSEGYRSVFGKAPSQSKEKTVINLIRFTTPLGPMFGCATTQGICLVEFTNRKMLETEFKDLCKRLNAVILPGTNKHLVQLEKEMNEYFNGERKDFSVTLHAPGTTFQQNVWNNLQRIPYGETRSYKKLATDMNIATAIRAVASANGHNRISIIIPCHRVIGENGNLTGYGGGLPRKKWLLDFEKANSKS